MNIYNVCLPKNTHWNDDDDNWIETTYTTGKLRSRLYDDIDEDDKYGVIHADSLDDIPVLVGGEYEVTRIND
jgi:hypothetical protein